MTSRWRPKDRRQILQLNDEDAQPHAAQTSSTNNNPVLPKTSSANKLHALLGHYNSDDEDSESDENSEFKTFMSEIKTVDNPPPPPSTPWQELWDPQSGQPYYWNTLTNELTWEKPKEMMNPTPSKQESETAKVIKKPEIVTKEIAGPPPAAPTNTISAVTSLPTTKQSSTFHPSATSTLTSPVDTKKELQARKEDTKISFKLTLPEKSVKNGDLNSAKVNGKVWDADSIIAAIEKEVPPDHKQEVFVPLFKRRNLTADKDKPKLGNDFKSFFRPSSQSILDFDSESSLQALPTIPTTHRGLGYEDKESETTEEHVKPQQQLQFVPGEILKPLVPTTPLTLDERMKLLESQISASESSLEFSKQKVIAQLEVLKDAWKKKKLDGSYLDEWLTSVEANLNDTTVKECETQDQVVDMILEETDSENEDTPKTRSPVAVPTANCPEVLDSELSSFYNDLASLDSASQPAAPPTNPPVSTAKSEETGPPRNEPPAINEEENMGGDLVKGSKRAKMSSDMTSLVAKWQRIQQENT